ncbi:hypothetical protein [Chitinophaga filiformis]|uniref:hypothetical protein n=1 Tax=Chitinophaga filiformis TaxID=104663 RepID=UPI00397A93D1
MSNHQHQGMLLPPDLSDLIASNHPVRVVNDVLDKVDITALLQQDKLGGTSSYHLCMLFKVRFTATLIIFTVAVK